MPTHYVYLAVAIVFNATGQLLLKQAALRSAAGEATRAFISLWFVGGVGSLGISMILWVLALRKIPLTIAHPISGIVFAIVPIIAHLLWREKLPAMRVVGILSILLGIVLVARGELR